MGGLFETSIQVTFSHHRLDAMETVSLNGICYGNKRWYFFDVDDDVSCGFTSGLKGISQHPGDGLTVEHDFALGQHWLILFGALVVDAGNVLGGDNPHDTWHLIGTRGVNRIEFGVRIGG